MIPKIIHQIWIGDQSKKPEKHMNTWKNNHPEWDYKIWTEKEIDNLSLINKDKYDSYYKDRCYNGVANVLRVELVNTFGGIYVDADSISTAPMDDLLNHDFFAVYSPNINGRVGNAFFGSKPNNPILEEYIKRIGELKKLHPSYQTSGGTTFGQVLKDFNNLNKVLPSYSFYLTDKNNKKTKVVGKNYGTHYWGTTHNSY